MVSERIQATMEETGESDSPATNLQLAIQCCRASLFLSSLRPPPVRPASSSAQDVQMADEERIRKQVVDLSKTIYMTRQQRRKNSRFENAEIILTFVVVCLFFIFGALELSTTI